jgi:hypothetical protein
MFCDALCFAKHEPKGGSPCTLTVPGMAGFMPDRPRVHLCTFSTMHTISESKIMEKDTSEIERPPQSSLKKITPFHCCSSRPFLSSTRCGQRHCQSQGHTCDT